MEITVIGGLIIVVILTIGVMLSITSTLYNNAAISQTYEFINTTASVPYTLAYPVAGAGVTTVYQIAEQHSTNNTNVSNSPLPYNYTLALNPNRINTATITINHTINLVGQPIYVNGNFIGYLDGNPQTMFSVSDNYIVTGNNTVQVGS